ncbi:hypothetical protein OsI_15923 [Oryza sativa Indica Group]|jgi:hypothetical protein|uniref:Uncharacterized protein n=1 Tax=Oryza sativa subsp. indica TaxID=39946 RepID=B8ATT1_ORYSI|nr:hypothetical protein OsI_15923 [Oryza sativa Indica Group]
MARLGFHPLLTTGESTADAPMLPPPLNLCRHVGPLHRRPLLASLRAPKTASHPSAAPRTEVASTAGRASRVKPASSTGCASRANPASLHRPRLSRQAGLHLLRPRLSRRAGLRCHRLRLSAPSRSPTPPPNAAAPARCNRLLHPRLAVQGRHTSSHLSHGDHHHASFHRSHVRHRASTFTAAASRPLSPLLSPTANTSRRHRQRGYCLVALRHHRLCSPPLPPSRPWTAVAIAATGAVDLRRLPSPREDRNRPHP